MVAWFERAVVLLLLLTVLVQVVAWFESQRAVLVMLVMVLVKVVAWYEAELL